MCHRGAGRQQFSVEDCDVDVDTEMAESEWLQANIMLDKLLRGSVCYQDGERQQIRMADMPKLELPN